MSLEYQAPERERLLPQSLEAHLFMALARGCGLFLLALLAVSWLSLVSWSVSDPSLTHVTREAPRNWLGYPGAILSDLMLQTLGLAAAVLLLVPLLWACDLIVAGRVDKWRLRLALFPLAVLAIAAAISALPLAGTWPLKHGYGGIIGDAILRLGQSLAAPVVPGFAGVLVGIVLFAGGLAALLHAAGYEAKAVVLMVLKRGRGVSAGRGARFADPASDDGREPVWDVDTDSDLAARNHARFAEPSLYPSVAEGEPSGLPTGPASPAAAASRPRFEETPAQEREAAPVADRIAAGAEAGRHDEEPTLRPTLQVRSAPVERVPSFAPFTAVEDGRFGKAEANPGTQPAAHGAGSPHCEPRVPELRPLPEPLSLRTLGATVDQAPHDEEFERATDVASQKMALRFAPGAAERAAEKSADLAKPFRLPFPPLRARQTEAALADEPNAGSSEPRLELPPVVEEAPIVAAEPRLAAPPPVRASEPLREPAAPEAARVASNPRATAPARAAGPVAEPDNRPALLRGMTFRGTQPGYQRPSLNLLKRAPGAKPGPEFTQTMLRGNARLLQDVLADFGVKGEVKDIRPGPVVTLYEFEPARGTKAARIIGLADDIARSMSATAVRIAPIPGRTVMGIELPNVRREPVLLREMLEADAFRSSEGILPLAIGKSIGGEPVVVDLARMPHLLVAGTTGSGKSVGVNAMILSLLYRHGPETCRFLMIDPKMLELGIYNGIPHLLAPVVTDPAKAVTALQWVVAEMEERYKRMAKLSVRSVDVFNNRVRNAKKRGEMIARTVQTGFDRKTGRAIYEHEQMDLEPMAYIVVVIDEFADLMMVAGKEVEGAVQRLAQMARAAGIHLVMATQRPSVDVITGTVKANFPTRASYKVASKIDSRTILGEQGAEQLLGQGDMLFSTSAGEAMRVHGPFVADEEVEAIAEHLRAYGAPSYVPELARALSDVPQAPGAATEGGRMEIEELYGRAVALVRADRKASTSYLQRRLGIGYNRAADLIDRMEREGIVGPAGSGGRREIIGTSGPADEPGQD